jgi:hypothetical protein
MAREQLTVLSSYLVLVLPTPVLLPVQQVANTVRFDAGVTQQVSCRMKPWIAAGRPVSYGRDGALNGGV